MTRRLKRIVLDLNSLFNSFYRFGDGFMPHYEVLNIPRDATVMATQLDPLHPDQVSIVLQSDSFPVLHDGEEVPILTPLISVWQCEEWIKRRDAIKDCL